MFNLFKKKPEPEVTLLSTDYQNLAPTQTITTPILPPVEPVQPVEIKGEFEARYKCVCGNYMAPVCLGCEKCGKKTPLGLGKKMTYIMTQRILTMDGPYWRFLRYEDLPEEKVDKPTKA